MYSRAHVTDAAPEHCFQNVLSLLLRGVFWRREARDLGLS